MEKKIFEKLRKDHDVQRDLINKLVDTSGDTKKRREIFNELKDELANHATAEERHFYSPLIDHDMTVEKARHSIAEHNELDEIVEDLEEMDYSSPGWLTKAKTLKHKLEHHLEEEEREIFQVAGKALEEKEKVELGSSYTQEMKELRAS